MIDTKNNKDILFYVRCKPGQEGIFLQAGEIYPVYKISPNNKFYGIIILTRCSTKVHMFDSKRFEPTIIKEVEQNIEKVLA